MDKFLCEPFLRNCDSHVRTACANCCDKDSLIERNKMYSLLICRIHGFQLISALLIGSGLEGSPQLVHNHTELTVPPLSPSHPVIILIGAAPEVNGFY